MHDVLIGLGEDIYRYSRDLSGVLAKGGSQASRSSKLDRNPFYSYTTILRHGKYGLAHPLKRKSLNHTGFRSAAVYIFFGDYREAAQVSARDVEIERPPSRDMYVLHLTLYANRTYQHTCISTLTRCYAIDHIDKSTLEITQADDEVYTNMQELADELPPHSPRYVLLSYPLTLVRLLRVLHSPMYADSKSGFGTYFGAIRTALLPSCYM